MMPAKPEILLEPRPSHRLDWLLVALLSATAGTVDVIGFLGLGGLFVTHITGSLVVLAAHFVTDGFSQIRPAALSSGFRCGARDGYESVSRQGEVCDVTRVAGCSCCAAHFFSGAWRCVWSVYET